MKIINTAKFNLPIASTLERLAVYNALDVLTLFEIHDGLSELMDNNRWATYRFEMELQSALLDMSLNGTHVDQPARNEMVIEFTATVKDLTNYLNELLKAIGFFSYYLRMGVHEFATISGIELSTLPTSWDEWKQLPMATRRKIKRLAGEDNLKAYHKVLKVDGVFNPNSSTQKLKLFYHFFGIPGNAVAEPYYYLPPWLKTYGIKEHKGRKADGTYGPTADRGALDKIIKSAQLASETEFPMKSANYMASFFAKICLDISDLTKSLGFLRCRLDNGMFRSSFGAVTETGRLSSRANAMGFGSNGQNVTPKLRHIFTVPEGYKFAAFDYGQIESRIVAAICYRLFGMENYLAGTESGDLHSLAASMVWDDLPWPKDFTVQWAIKHGAFPKDMLKAAKKIASKPYYRGKSRRDMSKTLGHGTSYCGKPRQMSLHSHIDVKLIEHYQSVFFEVFPEIAQWHNWVAAQVQTKGEITTMLGRTRRFFGRPNDDATIREAVAFEPQSVAADYTNRALLKMHKASMGMEGFPHFPCKIVLQKHDELIVRFKESDEELICSVMKELMEQEMDIVSPNGIARSWVIPVDEETGWNLGFVSKNNPNGLSHPDPNRVRIIKPKSDWTKWKL